MSASDDIFAIPLSRLSQFERENLRSIQGDPYRVLRRKTKFVAAKLGVDEETAEKIVLNKIDIWIMEG